MSHRAPLDALLEAERRVVYAVAASPDGEILAEAGNRMLLPHQGILGHALTREGIAAWHEQILSYRKEGPEFVPRMYGQGAVLGVIDSPVDGVVVLAFGVSPDSLAAADARLRVEWMDAFRSAVKKAMLQAYGSASAPSRS
jgi:hypothetical protein